MALFKETFCKHCGKKVNLLARHSLNDDNYLCVECVKKVPSYIRNKLSLSYNYDDYVGFIDYMDYSKKTLKPLFSETAHYGSIHMDAVHHLFFIDIWGKDRLYFEMKNMIKADLHFEPEEIKDGFLKEKIIGNVMFDLQMNVPLFNFNNIVSYGDKAVIKNSLRSNDSKVIMPEGLLTFGHKFAEAWMESYGSFSDEEAGSEDQALKNAMALFMFDDLSNVTIEKVKEQRNRLIKTFHPDAGNEADTQYAQKINEAYEIIKNNIQNS